MKGQVELSLPMKMLLQLGVRQIKLHTDIVSAIKETNSAKAHLLTAKLNRLESTIIGLEDEAAVQETFFEHPVELLPEHEKKELEGNTRKLTEIIVEFSGMTGGETTERRKRIYTLLEHLERRVAEKRATVNYYRALSISVLAVAGLPPKKESSFDVRLELKIRGVNHG